MSRRSLGDGGVSFSCENGRHTSDAAATTADTVRQEVKLHLQCYSSDKPVDPYSDNPTLPRSKTVISGANCVHQTIGQASLPVGVTNGWAKDRKLVALHPAAVHSVKVNNGVHAHTSLGKQTGEKSLNGTDTAVSLQDVSCGVVQPKTISTIAASVAFNSINEREMSTRHSRKGQHAAAAEEENEKVANMPKKTRNALRSLTFGFGSNSVSRRRSVNALRKGEKKTEEEDAAVLPTETPLLVGKDMETLPESRVPSGLSVPDEGWMEDQVHPKYNETAQQNHQQCSSFQDSTTKNASSPSQEYRHQPHNLPSLSTSVIRHHCVRGELSQRNEDESPLPANNSPTLSSTSGCSSFLNSSESISIGDCLSNITLPIMAMSSPSRFRFSPSQSHTSSWQSKNHKPDMTPQNARRKLSDLPPPGMADLKGSPSSSSSSHSIKKRNTFCVRSSKKTSQPGWEMRQHVVWFLVETEQSYVESLKRIVKVYYEPLKRPHATTLVDSNLVREIFYQIPEICSIHERLLQQLTVRINCWDSQTKIGDIFVNTFSKCQLMDVYNKFIRNFMRAKANIEVAKQAKPMFAKFLEQRARDSEGKLTLDDLLIKPVQRIPRYVLFIKDLLKHTAPSHPDHAPLQIALGELTLMAERFNDSEKERERTDHLKDLLGSVDGLTQLLSTHSYFIRYDTITEVKGQAQKRDRFLFLFSDILVCAASRRKSSTFKRNSLVNLNSVFSEKFVKWHLPLTHTSLPQAPSPSCNQRRLNTQEKMLENFQRDESLLEQLTELSSSVHHPHQALVTALKDLQAEIRESKASLRTALDNLPLEFSRLDLIGSISPIFTQYSVLFPSQKIRDSWEEDFIRTKKTADIRVHPQANMTTPTSPVHLEVSLCPELEFQNPVILQSDSIGTQLTCAMEGLSVEPGGDNCLWVCSSNRLGGKISLVNLKPSLHPCISATNITIADSPITCISAIPSSLPPSSPSPSLPSLPSLPPHNTITLPPPDISICSTSTTSSASSSPNSFRMIISATPSTGSDIIKSMPCDKDDDLMYLDGELELLNLPRSDISLLGNSLSVQSITRVRSNSAPPCQNRNESDSTVETGQWNFSNASESTPESTWSAGTLQPLAVKEVGNGCGHCMWLGTGGGQILIYGPGDNIQPQSSRRVVDLNSHIHCITHVQGSVYIGLENGSLCVLDSANPSTCPHHYVVVGSSAVRCCVCVMGDVWVGCEGTMYRLDSETNSMKTLCSLPREQTIHSAVACSSSVWVSIDRSSLLHLLHAPSGELLTSVDCMRPVMDVLKPYNLIIRQHKSAALHITAIQLSLSHLVVGTSAGVVLAIPLPYIQPSLEPHTLPHTPTPTPLYYGHVDMVHFLTMVERGDETLVVTGGSGCEDFHKARSSSAIPETASCLLVWNVKH